MDVIDAIHEDLMVAPGTGATMSVGSDCYAYWIAEVLPNGVFGVVEAKSHFDDSHPWEGGTMVVEPYDSRSQPEFFIKRLYKKWWKVSRDGKARICKFSGKYNHFSIGQAIAYRDPSF